MRFVIDDEVELVFEQCLIGSHVGIGGDNDTAAFIFGGVLRSFFLRSLVVAESVDVESEVLAVVLPVGDLLL